MKGWQFVAAVGPIGALFLLLADYAIEAKRQQADLCRWEDDGGPAVEE